MHSKLMLVDGSAAIVGGRNVADEYFDLDDARNFRDRDVLLVGPLVARSGEAFDLSWSSWSSFPIAAVSAVHPDAQEIDSVLNDLRKLNAAETSPIAAARNPAEGAAFFERSLRTATWAPAELIYNRPQGKGEKASFDQPGPIALRLAELVENTQRKLLVELHAKTAVFDDALVYIGSFNFNPRSVFLNTEFAVIIHSESFARKIASDIVVNLSGDNSWVVEADSAGALRWVSDDANGRLVYETEPQTSVWRRLKSALIALFPVERYY